MRLVEPIFRRRSLQAAVAALAAGALALVCGFASQSFSSRSDPLRRAATNADSRDEIRYIANGTRIDELPRRPVESRDHQGATVLPVHDFGIVRPGSRSNCKFAVCNNSDRRWILDKAQVNCVCTVARVSFKELAPGDKGFATVQLRAGDDVGDIRKSVALEFKHGVPPVVLPVFAAVRQPMTPDAAVVTFSGIRPKTAAKRVLAVRNFSGSDWREVTVEDSPGWADVSVSGLRNVMEPRQQEGGNLRGADDTAPPASPRERQSCAVTVTLTAGELAEGYHHGPVKLRSDTGETCELYVSAHITPPVRVVPDSIVFGPVTAGACEPRLVRIVLADAAPASINAVAAPTNGGAPRITVRRIDGRTWQLRAVPTGGKGDAHGAIRVSLPPGFVPREITVPYSVFSPDVGQIASSSEAKP